MFKYFFRELIKKINKKTVISDRLISNINLQINLKELRGLVIIQSVPERSGKSVKIQNKEHLKVILLVCKKC